MDTFSAADVARELGTSIPRIQRASDALKLGERRGGGRRSLSHTDVEKLRRYLGVTPKIEGFSTTETKVLAALSRSPLGVASNRVLAARASVSPTAAGRAVEDLKSRGLIRSERHVIALGRAKEVDILRANVLSPQWRKIAPLLSQVRPPLVKEKERPAREQRVPPRLRHLFWNTAESQLKVGRSGGYIARRLITTGNLEGLAWGAVTLRPADWLHAATTRGLSPDRKALAVNLAAKNRKPKAQFLHADEASVQRQLEPTKTVASIKVAGIEDLLAMKLKVLAERGELRDYYDVMMIEEKAHRAVEEGLQLYLARYQLPAEPYILEPVVRALGYLDDVDEDELVPISKQEVATYWQRRQREVIQSLGQFYGKLA